MEQQLELFTLPSSEKRIVLQHTQGNRTGMFTILGRSAEVPSCLMGPVPVPGDTHSVEFANLIGVRGGGRWVLYREIMPEAIATGKLNDFHPNQV